MTTIKKGDFVEIDYTGSLKDGGDVFDTTDSEVAKKHELQNRKTSFGSVIICLGEHHLLKSLDEELIGKEVGSTHAIELNAERAFGKKDASLIQLLPAKTFREHDIKPVPGLEVTIDGVYGTVKSISGGRIMVDFNHPLSGRDVVYEVTINRVVSDTKEKLVGFLKTVFSLNKGDYELDVSDGTATITLEQEPPQQIVDELSKKVSEVITEISKVVFKARSADKEK